MVFPGIAFNPTGGPLPAFNPTGTTIGDIFSVIDRFVNDTLPVIINRGPATGVAAPPPAHPQAPKSQFGTTEILLIGAVVILVTGLIVLFAKKG